MPRKKPQKQGKVGIVLMVVGAVIMLVGAGSELAPLSGVSLSPDQGIQITGISPLDASLIGIGAIIFLAGVVLYSKGK